MLLKDPIYGYVKISDFIYPFFIRPEFQRLRKIKQLGFAYLVFENATHCRFEHSVGVMHVTMKMMDELLKQDSSLFTEREYNLISLAALFHDIGHSAFSHIFDSFLEIYFRINGQKEIQKGFFSNKTHEKRSIYLLRKINQELNILSEDEILFIQHLIEGVPQEGKPNYFYQILSTKKIDSDRLDYISRDIYYTSNEYVDFLPIIEGIQVIDGDIYYSSFNRRRIENFVRTREDMYKNIYENKRVVQKSEVFLNYMLEYSDSILNYGEMLCDSVLMEILRKKKSSPKSLKSLKYHYEPPRIKKISSDIPLYF